jgi:hypothetical protein
MRWIQKNIISSIYISCCDWRNPLQYMPSLTKSMPVKRKNLHWNHYYAVEMPSEKNMAKSRKTKRLTCIKLLLRNKNSDLQLGDDDRAIGIQVVSVLVAFLDSCDCLC